MNAALGLTASGLIRALSPHKLQSAIAKRADVLASELEAELARKGIKAQALAEARDGETTVELTGPNLWQREYGSFTEPESADVSRALQTVKEER